MRFSVQLVTDEHGIYSYGREGVPLEFHSRVGWASSDAIAYAAHVRGSDFDDPEELVREISGSFPQVLVLRARLGSLFVRDEAGVDYSEMTRERAFQLPYLVTCAREISRRWPEWAAVISGPPED